ncbi:hypothetical protein C8R45DRAFT_1103485 [Mycena sanguinolenta]|nr:hypothetical protein C8R45DRAFT_1103485 [Mycena sanguinolenta]
MDGISLKLEMEVAMMEGYLAAAYHAHHHVEAQADLQEPEVADPPHRIRLRRRRTTRTRCSIHICTCIIPAPLETHALEPALALFARYLLTPQLAYSYAAETMLVFGMLVGPEDAPGKYEYEPSRLDADLELLHTYMNPSTSISMGIGTRMGGVVEPGFDHLSAGSVFPSVFTFGSFPFFYVLDSLSTYIIPFYVVINFRGVLANVVTNESRLPFQMIYLTRRE